MQGWIKDYRKELGSDIWMMPPLYHRVWQYLKYDVNHEAKTIPTKYGKLKLKKGQTATSYQKIAKDVAWYEWGIEKVPNKKTIKSILDWLENSEMIKRESNAKGTVITVCNYCDYQGVGNGESNAKETQKKRSLDTNKNGKNKDTPQKVNSTKVSIDYYHDSFVKKFNTKPLISGGKDGALMKKVVDTYGIDKTKELLDKYFLSKDEFVVNSGYTISVFYSQINKLIAEGKPRTGLGDL